MKIACVLENDFEDSEFKVPYDELKKAGHEVEIVGLEQGKALTGKRGREKTRVERGIDDADAASYDALFIPGGFSPDKLRADERMVRFTRQFAGRPILAICHGPQLLLTAGMVHGRQMTAWKTVQHDLRQAGAIVRDEPVVVDGNLVTSRKPEDLPAFVFESLAVLQAERPELHA